MSEVRGLLQDAEAPDILTKAVRYFADDFGLSMGVITAVGKQSLNYYTCLSKIAERNLKNRGFNVKNIDPKIVFGEMKAIRNAQFEKLKTNNKATIGKRIGNYFNEKGILSFEKIEDLTEIFKIISEPDHYESLLPIVEENYNLVQQYNNYEDWMFENVYKKILNEIN